MKNLVIPYAWEKKSPHDGPIVVVNAGSHGNEIPGIESLDQFMDLMTEIELLKGKVVCTLGDPVAIEKGVRSVNKRDVNKCFGNVSDLFKDGALPEAVRAQQLKGAWAGADVLFDLHSTIEKSRPFLTVPNVEKKKEYADLVLPHLGVQTLITGSGLMPPNGDNIYSDSYVDATGGLGITVELGWTKDPEIKDIAQKIKNALIAMEMIEGEIQKPDFELEMWDACENVIAGPGFQFVKQFGNFEFVSAGTKIAEDDAGEFIAEDDCITLFPKPNEYIVAGQEACILAKKM